MKIIDPMWKSLVLSTQDVIFNSPGHIKAFHLSLPLDVSRVNICFSQNVDKGLALFTDGHSKN